LQKKLGGKEYILRAGRFVRSNHTEGKTTVPSKAKIREPLTRKALSAAGPRD
jgi:hypothetical protein